jgi:drug/metabolite transporter (DMT)-like permease
VESAEAEGKPHSNLRGAAWMVAAAVCFASMALLVKFLGSGYPAALQTFYRQAAGFVVVLPIIVRHRAAAFATTRPGVLFFRSAAGTLATTFAFYSFQHMPLAEANALSFTRALWIIPLAAVVVRERIGPLRIAAALVGFAGVVLMLHLKSGGTLMGLPAASMLASSLLFALTITGMKVLTRDHAPRVVLVWTVTLGAVLAIPGALMDWRWPTPRDFVLLSLVGVCGTGSLACYIRGMEAGDASALAPIDYLRLVFAGVGAYVFFGETPTVWTIAGASVVVASTLFITLREHQTSRAAAPAAVAASAG